MADGVVGPATAAIIDGAAPPSGPPPAEPAAKSGRPSWLLAALGWLGTKEQPGSGDNPVILRWAKDQGGAIGKDYTHNSIPWCALFTNAVLQQVGLKGTGTLWALDFAKWGQGLPGPAIGAFAAMKRDGGGHITIVVGRDQHGNLMCCGGNQSDAVTIAAVRSEARGRLALAGRRGAAGCHRLHQASDREVRWQALGPTRHDA